VLATWLNADFGSETMNTSTTPLLASVLEAFTPFMSTTDIELTPLAEAIA